MKHRPPLKVPRSAAFRKQSGLCFYCGLPMWEGNPEEFASRHGLTMKQAMQFQATGEHLTPHAQGGSGAQKNIAAACCRCNISRHRMGHPMSPEMFGAHVMSRMNSGKWHSVRPHQIR